MTENKVCISPFYQLHSPVETDECLSTSVHCGQHGRRRTTNFECIYYEWAAGWILKLQILESIFLLCSLSSSSVGSVHCVDVAVQLVSKRQPGLGGEIDLGAPTEASRSLAVTAPGCRGSQARLHLLYGHCRWGALPTLAALFTASVERKTLQHLHTHDRNVWWNEL